MASQLVTDAAWAMEMEMAEVVAEMEMEMVEVVAMEMAMVSVLAYMPLE
ncbi:MAG: hypothetical protein ACRDHW_11350 [Ktedonobacteraceae bacterium]